MHCSTNSKHIAKLLSKMDTDRQHNHYIKNNNSKFNYNNIKICAAVAVLDQQQCTTTTLRANINTPALRFLHKRTHVDNNVKNFFKRCLLLKSTFLIYIILTFYQTNIVSAKKFVRELEVSEGVPVGAHIGYIDTPTHGGSQNGIEAGNSGEQYIIWKVTGSAEDADLAFDLNTGEIKTKKLLDRETRASYSVTALRRKTNEQVRVLITVQDENDNAPTFPQPIMHIEFPENTPRDVKRTLNPARDLDLGRNNTQRYNIVSGNVNNAFRLSSHRERDGVLYLDLQINGFLDRETTPEYQLLIEALDGGNPPLRGQMTVNITIQDVNDNQPIFNQSRYFAAVPENATVGTSVLQVYASDTDAGDNGRVEYAINRRQSDKQQMFRIDVKTGLISVNKPLDFETKELHELVVVAKDQGEQPLETTTFVSIRVTDVNDNQPMINVIFLSDDATPKISESAQPGEFVARISVNDPDNKAEYDNVNVTLNGGDGHFGLTTRDNIIYLVIVNLSLDRESQPNYTLSVVATDNGTPPLHASRTIYLRVTDINDNEPEFERTVYHANVMEIADPGTSVIQVVAHDRDEGNNSFIFYTLAETMETHSQWFQIDTHTGLITTRLHIDCETEPVPQLTVIAKDNGYPPLSSTARVFVTIHDVNDNEPIFDQSFYNVSVSENDHVGKCVLKVSASDPDCGVNAMVNYALDEGAKKLDEFEIRSLTGEICIAGELDYEKRTSYEFPVIATDKGGLSTTAMVKVQLTDYNDNHPIFYPKEYNVSLRESASASTTPIVSVVATDLDSGRFGTISYKIVAGNEAGIFRIERSTGDVFINRPNTLTARSQQIHMLNVSATDGGGLRAVHDAVIFLSIIDATQRPPIFEKSRYNYSIKENVPKGTVVGSVVTSTADSTLRNMVRYSIYSGDPNRYFAIDSVSGTIRVANILDHENQAQVLLNIQATAGSPPSYGHTQVNIDVEDVNDNAPEFETSMVRISVPENVELGTPLYAAHAHDRDSGRNSEVTYGIIMVSDAQTITRNDTYSNDAYVYEHSHSTNQGTNLNYRQQAMASERTASAAALTTLDNQTKKSKQKLFVIDAHSGHLTLSQHLDYELVQRHSLIVTATDGGEPPLTANLTILVEVQDVNDNAPVFRQKQYSVKVLESLPVNSQILQVNAWDTDTGNNARITYRIIGIRSSGNNTSFDKTSLLTHRKENQSLLAADLAENPLFGIFPNSGWIYLRGILDRETRDRYELSVMASDNGTPSAHAQSLVVVQVLDANDNDPQFLRVVYEFSVEENLRGGALVGVIGATDLDLAKNAEIQYSLLPANGSFQVNSITGEIVTLEPLNREQKSEYDLIAEARDHGTPSRSARVPIKVHITDVNDNDPEIVDPQEDLVSVREGQPAGTEVVRIRAIDRDNGINATVKYSITNGRESTGIFSIDPYTGVIKTCVVLDHEERSIYAFEVAATDGGYPARQSKRMLRVEVFDLNDNRPTFTSSSLVFRVREDATVGHVIGSIGSSEYGDRQFISHDESNVQITITALTNDIIPNSFDIDRSSGSLIVTRKLDREKQAEYRLKIQALDTSVHNNPQSSAITIKVEIADVNDNAPKFPYDPIEINVNEDIAVGTVLYNFTATDADSGTNSELQYKLLNYIPKQQISKIFKNNMSEEYVEQQLFHLETLTGDLTLLMPLDYETIKEYILLVQALDQSSNISERMQTTVTVLLHVQDVNDNAPQFVSPPLSENTIDSNVFLKSSARVGETVAHVLAVDKDNGDNARISYAIVNGNDGGYFAINSTSGYIGLVKPLPATVFKSETDASKFNLIVSASDHGIIPSAKQSLLNLNFIIEQVSTVSPRFLQAVYQATISENEQSGTFVLQVSAKSYNGPRPNVNFTYEIPIGVADNHFHVDSQRGIITTLGQLDRETNPQYRIPIYVYDSNSLNNDFISSATGRKQRSSSDSESAINEMFDVATIIITVSDVNDHAPEFRPGACYPLAVPESSPQSIIHTVIATDLDEGLNSEIVYNIIGGNVGNKFSIDMSTGELKAQSLDREQQSRYVLQIQAQDRGSPISYQGHCNISVLVEDLNDNYPQFEQVKYKANVIENVLVGTSVLRVHATDADLGVNARLTYKLANETHWLFNIDPKTGIITTAGALDREKQAFYDFVVVATDSGRYIVHSASVQVQITVDDVNDNKPIFKEHPYRIQVATVIQPGKSFLQVEATDADAGLNGEITYSLSYNENDEDTNFNMMDKFRINARTGVISATQSLATNVNRLLHIKVTACDKGHTVHCANSLIKLLVGETRVDMPTLRFQNETYRVKIREHADIGTRLLIVNAGRNDGRRQNLIYSIIAGNEENTFSINPTTGEIRVQNANNLDYEKFTVDSRKEHNGIRSRSIAPFEQLNLTNVMLDDIDLDIVRDKRESEDTLFSGSHEIRLIVSAHTDPFQSPQTLYAYTKVIVAVEDINDNNPQFTQKEYSAVVKEAESKGTFVLRVHAIDADAPGTANSHILYHIVDGNHDNAFIIEPAFSGIVKTNIVLDREIRDMYKLKVIATDEGLPQTTGTATIRIHIVDVNDNQPTFPPHSIININEAAELGTLIATVSANDIDTFPALTYQFANDSLPDERSNTKKLFSVDRFSGKVLLKNNLDYEQQQEYQLEIVASDKEHDVHTTLTVRVVDFNDNTPMFEAQQPPAYFAILPDPFLHGTANNAETELLVLNATDADGDQSNSEIQYNIDPPVAGFHINRLTGALSVNMSAVGELPNSAQNYFYVNVIAQDSGTPSRRSMTVVRAQTSNDFAARTNQFIQTHYQSHIKEDAPLGTIVIKLNNDIFDTRENTIGTFKSKLNFVIVSGNEQGYFEVVHSTCIILVKQLDREQQNLHKLRLVMGDIHTPTQQLVQQSKDNSTASITVFVTVEDINDNAPQFLETIKYETEISELAPLRYSIAQFTALDTDQENTPNSEVVYDITSGNDERMFAIDLLSGVLFVNNQLDYDTGAHTYQLILRACDSGIIQQCTLKHFKIQLKDENDNIPQFALSEQIEYIGENEPIGTLIFMAHATDLDRGPFGLLNYTLILDGMLHNLFKIDTQTGVVTSNAIFDYEKNQSYEVTLYATDAGGKNSSINVRILIDSRDEFAPQFTQSTYHFDLSIPSSGYVPLGQTIGQVHAVDDDKGPDGRVIYQIRPQHSYFKINRTTGSIMLKKKLLAANIEKHDFNMLIIASSGRQSSLESKVVVEIAVDSVDEIGTNLASSSNSAYGNATNWILGFVIVMLMILCALAGIFLFMRMRKSEPRNIIKPHLTSESTGNTNSYVDSNVFETMPIRAANNMPGSSTSSVNNAQNNNMIVGAQFAPPKYDEIPPYAPHAGSSGAATTSELSGSEQSGSSGRGSAEDDGEDEEIRMINEGGTLHNQGSAASGNSTASIDGRISEISVQNTQEYLARLGIVQRDPGGAGVASNSSHHHTESLAGSNKGSHMHHTLPSMVDPMQHLFDADPTAEADLTNLIYAKLNDVTGMASERSNSTDEAGTTAGSIGAAVDHVMNYSDMPVVGNANIGPSMNGSLSSIVHSEEELTGSYNWDYLLDWGPQYQPLAHVFSEIARLKDDTLSVNSGNSGASSSRTKHSLPYKPHIPPPLITNVAPRSINMPVLSNNNSAPHYLSNTVKSGTGPQYMLPRSPINYDTTGSFTTSAAMSPSFSPSLSPLATRSPSISPLSGVPGGQNMVSLSRHAPLAMQRGKKMVVDQNKMIL